MKKFTKNEIEGTRNYFRTQGFKEVDVALGNRRFSYFVVPQSLEPNLPDFVIRLTGEPADGHVLGISDSVREEHRSYAVAHEFIEFTEIGIGAPDRCARALEEELRLVPENQKPSYLPMRRGFFRNLIAYCSNQPAGLYTESDLNQFRKNLATLEKLVG